jgi:hypothetical protein
VFWVSAFSEFPFVNIANQYTSTLNETTTLSDIQSAVALFFASQDESFTLLDYQIQRGWIKILAIK